MKGLVGLELLREKKKKGREFRKVEQKLNTEKFISYKNKLFNTNKKKRKRKKKRYLCILRTVLK